MQYRILETLRYYETNRRIEAGTIDSLKRLSPETIKMLLDKGRIAEVVPPPLAIIPGWKEKAVEYAEKGVHTVNDMSGDEGEDFEEAKRWSTVGHDGPGATPDFLTTPIGEGVFELTEVDEDDDMGTADALTNGF